MTRLRSLARHLHRAVPVRRAHPPSVNARVVAWAVAQGGAWVLFAPFLALLLVLAIPAALFEGVRWLTEDAIGGLEHRARLRKWGVHNGEIQRRVCAWVGELVPIAEPVPGVAPSVADLRRGFDIGNGVRVRWWRGPKVMLTPGHHSAPLFDDEAFREAVALAEASRIEYLERDGHTPHCARRIVWGDGECECGGLGEQVEAKGRVVLEWMRGDDEPRD